MALQQGKVVNLKAAVPYLHGILIKPGEYFSFCLLVGRPTRKRGFTEGMELAAGRARAGVGGGLCQLANLIHWMALHSPLQIVERAAHSFDPFPDDGRVLPFGSGAAIFYNFVDLVLYNPTEHTFQILCEVGEHQLKGRLLCCTERTVKYHVYEKNHRFINREEHFFRANEIWRDTTTKGHNPKTIVSEFLYSNCSLVMYALPEDVKVHGNC